MSHYSAHDGESCDLNDRVHGISCQYSDKISKTNIALFLMHNRFSQNKKHIPPNYSKQTFISKLLHNVK